jgi:hypothetical protein
MNDLNDLKLLIQSQTPLIIIESNEEQRVVSLCHELAQQMGLPISKWTVTTGLHRLGPGFAPQKFNSEPTDVLRHIRSLKESGIFLLLDFHPYLENPLHTRLLREIAQNHSDIAHHVILLSPQLETPRELIVSAP